MSLCMFASLSLSLAQLYSRTQDYNYVDLIHLTFYAIQEIYLTDNV